MTWIQQTTITSGDDFDVVELHISDRPLDDASANLRITIAAKLPGMKTPVLAFLQRAAMAAAQDALTPILRSLARDLQEAGYGTQPVPRNPKR